MATIHSLRPPTAASSNRFVQLGGQAVHVFNFAASPSIAYEYFCDVPAVFSLLPDALHVSPYATDRYRLVVGATDGHGHTMAGIFDLQAIHEPGQSIRVIPDEDGPPVTMPGLVFNGFLAAEAVFHPSQHGTSVEYTVDIEMDIPVPSMLNLIPQGLLQNLGEKGMEFKMTHMITGFTRSITNDFHRWIRGG